MITDEDRIVVEQTIHATIGWALTKDFDRLYSAVAQDEDFFIFHPDSKSTIIGFEAFKNMSERAWKTDAFKATEYKIKELRLVPWKSVVIDGSLSRCISPFQRMIESYSYDHYCISQYVEVPVKKNWILK
jgi:hypothetical protein